MSVDALGVDARLELLEDLPAHDLETLAGLVVLVCRFLAGDDRGIFRKPGLLDHVIQRGDAVFEEPPHQQDRFGQIGQ